MSRALQKSPPGSRSPANLPDAEQVMALARVLFAGGLCSKNCNKPEAVAARIVAGMEVGLSPVQAVNWIAVINGRAVIWGDAALALVRASGLLDGDIIERWEGEGDDRTAVCITRRKGAAEARTTTFSVAAAKLARLWGKEGPWTDYPDRQLMWRARGWNLRDNFNDVLCGLGIAEEELDVPAAVKVVSHTVDLPAAPPAVAPKAPTAAEAVADEATILKIAAARGSWLRFKGIDPDDDTRIAEAWGELLGGYGVTSARQLSQAKAEELFKTISTLAHVQEVTEVFGSAEPATAK